MPSEYETVVLAHWLGVGPWELMAHPEWYEAVSVVQPAYDEAVAILQAGGH